MSARTPRRRDGDAGDLLCGARVFFAHARSTVFLRVSVMIKGLATYFASADRAGLPQPNVRRSASHQRGRWSISVTGAWRLTFRWESGDVLELDLEQYH